MFANRNPMLTETGLSIDDTIGIRDFEALLDALIQKNNTNWIGKNCNYGSAPSCSLSTNTFDDVQVYGRRILVPEVLFSKCYSSFSCPNFSINLVYQKNKKKFVMSLLWF